MYGVPHDVHQVLVRALVHELQRVELDLELTHVEPPGGHLDADVHEVAIQSLKSVARIKTCAQVIEQICE